jgi:hypothetical protein
MNDFNWHSIQHSSNLAGMRVSQEKE